jgi:dienelactone hydrolase
VTDPGLPGQTIYAPSDLSALRGQKLPIVAWAEGGCIDNGTRYRWFLSEIASHGYIVLALGKMGPNAEEVWKQHPAPIGPVVMPDPSTLPPLPTRSAQLIEAIDWAIAENGRTGSRYSGAVDTSKIAVMGMSCGGIQAIQAARDPRVTTTVVWNSGLFPDGSPMNKFMGGVDAGKDSLNRLHGSVAYISGDENDIAFANANDDFERLQGLPAFRGYRKDTPHDGTYGAVNGGSFGLVAVAWLDWQLKGDQAASRMFVGPHCALCRDPQWVVKQKNIR